MEFSEKLKTLRKTAGLSQEKLAEKLNVSRQAITKWETDAGTPEVENIMAIAALFGVSLDELLSGGKPRKTESDFLFESVTEYDIDRFKRYDMKLGGAKQIRLCGGEGEKLRVRLASNQISSLESDFKVKIDDSRDHIDIDLARKNGMTEATAKEALAIFVVIPEKYARSIELAANSETVEIAHLACEDIELDVKASRLLVDDVSAAMEVNCNLDMLIRCLSLKSSIDVNQISATSRLELPADCAFRAVVKGLGNSVSYEKDGKVAEDFSDDSAEITVELNGMKSELVIARESEE